VESSYRRQSLYLFYIDSQIGLVRQRRGNGRRLVMEWVDNMSGHKTFYLKMAVTPRSPAWSRQVPPADSSKAKRPTPRGNLEQGQLADADSASEGHF
jgi:hypothetical protein